MPLDPAVVELLQAMKSVGVTRLGHVSAAEMRAILAGLRASGPPGPDLYAVWDEAIPSRSYKIPIRVYQPGSAPTGVLVYFHGGGWTLGSIDEFDSLTRTIAKRANVTVLSVDYRLAPEFPFPAAVDDAVAALHWASRQREHLSGPNGLLLLGGDSAGGNLSVVASHLACDAGGPHISGLVLIYPALAGDIDSPALTAFDAPHLTHFQLKWFFEQYIPDRDLRSDPRFAPILRTDLRNLPPALIVSAEFDLLKAEQELYAHRLDQAGCRVQWISYPGMIHGFFGLGSLAQVALVHREIADFVMALADDRTAIDKLKVGALQE
jgi:acetyl esterase